MQHLRRTRRGASASLDILMSIHTGVGQIIGRHDSLQQMMHWQTSALMAHTDRQVSDLKREIIDQATRTRRAERLWGLPWRHIIGIPLTIGFGLVGILTPEQVGAALKALALRALGVAG